MPIAATTMSAVCTKKWCAMRPRYVFAHLFPKKLQTARQVYQPKYWAILTMLWIQFASTWPQNYPKNAIVWAAHGSVPNGYQTKTINNNTILQNMCYTTISMTKQALIRNGDTVPTKTVFKPQQPVCLKQQNHNYGTSFLPQVKKFDTIKTKRAK